MVAPLNVCDVACEVKVVALLVKLPEKVKVAAAPVIVSSQTAPAFKVTSAKDIALTVPLVEPKLMVPVIDVVPVTVNGRYIVREAPVLIVRFTHP